MAITSDITPRLVLTSGEPAGVGPDIVLTAAQRNWPAELLYVGDVELLTARAAELGLDTELIPFTTGDDPGPHRAGQLRYIHVPLAESVVAGQLNIANASYVLATLNLAAELCRVGDAHAMVTAPVQKSVINEAGIPFSGHTEFLAQAFDTPEVVMLLAAGDLRVALATTHLPLAEVPSAVTRESLTSSLQILARELTSKWGIEVPRITVLGLNPHAGEGGHLGSEEINIIAPALEALRAKGFELLGPLPADTAFNDETRAVTDAYLAMYHDQGLPVLKYAGFGEAVNVTLGLPILRTSVDHGTALTLAGTGKARSGSLEAAIDLTVRMMQQRLRGRAA
jgi:4-hydroxythreonine-4-phosphate dehydrogenase